jgi:hypothetical protein
LYDTVVPGEVRLHRIKELHELFFERMPEEKDYFKNNNIIVTSYKFCCEIIKTLESTT